MATSYLIIFDNCLNVFSDLSDAQAGRLIKMLADYHRGNDVSSYFSDPVLKALSSIFFTNIDAHKEATARKIEGNSRGGKKSKSPQVNSSQPKLTQVNPTNNNSNSNNNININNNTTTGVVEKKKKEKKSATDGDAATFRNEVYQSQIKAEQIAQVLRITIPQYYELADMVITEWDAKDLPDEEYNFKHLIDHMRIKIEERNRKANIKQSAANKEMWRAEMVARTQQDYINTFKKANNNEINEQN